MDAMITTVPDTRGGLRSQLPHLFNLAAIFFVSFVSRIILAPLLLTVEEELHMGHAQAGTLFTFISGGVFVGLLGSGVMSARWTYRQTVLVSTVVIGAACMAVAKSPSSFWMRGSLTLLGFGAGLYFPSGVASITSLIARPHWGKALAIHELAPNAGFVLAPLLAELLARFMGWRDIVYGLGMMSFVGGLVFLRLGRGRDLRGEQPNGTSILGILGRGSFWIMVVLFVLSVGGSLGVYTMAPLFLVVERGFDREVANQLVAFSRLPGVGMALLAGWVVDRLGIKRSIGCFCAATGVATVLLGLDFGRMTVWIVALQALLSVGFFPAGYAALARVVRLSQGAMGVAVCSSIAIVCGAGLLPSGLGFLAERGAFSLGFLGFGSAMVLAAGLAYFVKFEDGSAGQSSAQEGER